MIAEFLKNTVGHTEINAQGEDDRWLINGDIGVLSRLVELRMDAGSESQAVLRGEASPLLPRVRYTAKRLAGEYVKALGDRNWQLDALGKGEIVIDRQRLTQALINLAQNATQYTENTDTIALGSSLGGKSVRFWVRDTGQGITPEDQERIFQRFVRGMNSGSGQGTGLGLAIMQAIAECFKQ